MCCKRWQTATPNISLGHYRIDNTMTRIQFGFCMPADKLDKQRRATFSEDLNRALDLVTGHFDSAWIIDHLQFGDDDMLEGFTALSYMAALHPQLRFGHSVLCQSFRNPALLAKMGATLQFLSGGRFILCGGFPKLTTLELLINEVLPALNT